MVLKLGFIGVGSMGSDHVERVKNNIQGAEISGLYDIKSEAVENVIKKFDLENVTTFDSSDELIESNKVDAVIVASQFDTHTEDLLKCIEVGKNVLVEKPMTATTEDSQKIIEAEVKAGKRYVQVGFMRRYDPGYQKLKEVIDSGLVGQPLMAHMQHHIPIPPTTYYDTEMVVNDAFIHEIDIAHYLFDQDYKSIEMKFARPTSKNKNEEILRDPQLAIFQLEDDALVTVELNMNSKFAYDIQCRVTGEKGIVKMPEIRTPELRLDNKIQYPILDHWNNRFIEGFNGEFQAFVDSVTKNNLPATPTAFDGLIANITSDAAIKSQKEGGVQEINIPERPKLYKNL